MKIRGKVIMGIMVVLSIFSVSSIALADDFLDLESLLENVNATYVGKEAIIPYFMQIDANKDKYYESIVYNYRIFRNNTTTLLYNTPARAFAYPAITCTNPTSVSSDALPKFVLSGKWAATVIDMEMECNSPTGNREAHNVAIYEADVSKVGGLVRVLGFNNHYLLSVELKDYNSDGKKDLLVLMVPPTTTGQYLRVVAKDFDTWATISDKIYPTSNIK